MITKRILSMLSGVLLASSIALPLQAEETAPGYATLRDGTEIGQEYQAPEMAKVQNTDKRQVRNYPEQPPVIPHHTRDYQIDLKVNKCLSCHGRTRIEESQAPMVSVTHFMDRDGQVLGQVAPRRYFCNQCHVSQQELKAPVENDFVDIDTLIKSSKQ